MTKIVPLLKAFVEIAKRDVTDPSLPVQQDREDGHSLLKMEFHRKGKQVLKVIANELGLAPGTYDIRSNLAGRAVSGEITLHGEHIYINFEQSSLGDIFMYRSCRDRKDCSGGSNNWMKWDALLDLPSACENFKRVL